MENNFFNNVFNKKNKLDVLKQKIKNITDDIFLFDFSSGDIAIIVQSIKEDSLSRLEAQKEHLENSLREVNDAIDKIKSN